MKEMILEPYSVQLNFKMDSPMTAGQWGRMLSDLIETLARNCSEAGPCVIGHLKGFARISENYFLRISAISADRPADVEARFSDDISKLSLTLNVMVYGHPKKMLAQLTRQTIDLSEKPWSNHVAMESSEHGHIQRMR